MSISCSFFPQVVPMTMTSNEKRMLEREALRSVIQQWNANRLDLFELSEPDEVRVLFVKKYQFEFWVANFSPQFSFVLFLHTMFRIYNSTES